ncbi:hypothetical protein RchiOBHm_Chr6g0270621 [Rosa chinensis]|uniref:Uncharacterized protein n=1 Tax=Rosa chinensis TaxID=74649 RepID=A0A2P6PQR2_ROSCH|nr:hypothetical protein RchiOBHm_Chr6g0270621 [Rosa chinensis]
MIYLCYEPSYHRCIVGLICCWYIMGLVRSYLMLMSTCLFKREFRGFFLLNVLGGLVNHIIYVTDGD